jgi:hypothetical protein
MLIPSGSSVSSPLEYRRNQDIFISSDIHINCNGSRSIQTSWSIRNCTAACTMVIPMASVIQWSSNEIVVPARTLPNGLYEFTLRVNMTNTMPVIWSSVSAFVRITRSGVIPRLIGFSTSFITHGSQRSLAFNPGAFSIDEDGYTFNANVMLSRHLHD